MLYFWLKWMYEVNSSTSCSYMRISNENATKLLKPISRRYCVIINVSHDVTSGGL